MAAAVAGTADIALFHFVPEPHKPPRGGLALLRAMRAPLHDRQFLWFAGFVATLVFAVSFMGQFVTLYAIEQAQFSNRTVQFMLLTAPLLAQLLVLPAWGRAVDRMGKKPVMKISVLGFTPLALGWMFLHAGNVWWGYVLSAVGAALWAGVEIANFNFVIEMSGSNDNGDGPGAANRGTSYAAVNTVIVSLAGCAGGLVGGGIAELLTGWQWQPLAGVRPFTYYDVLFVLSAVLRLVAAVVFLPHLHEPTARPATETFRFMTVNVYNNLYNAVLQPVRIVRGRLRGSESEQGI
jgi:MFS family permease